MIVRFLMAVLLVCLSACAQAPVSFDYDAASLPGSAKTYALETPVGPQSLDNNRIEAALRIQLGLNGLTEVASKDADIRFAYRIEQEHKLEESGVSFGIGFGSGNMGMGVGTGPRAKEVIEGKLVVDAIDPVRQQVVWTAKAKRFLRDSMKPEEREALINTLVAAMLVEFPPRGN